MMKRSPWMRLGLGLLLLAPPLLGIAWWIYVAQTNPGDHAAKVAQYLSPFPELLQDARFLTWIRVGFSGLALWTFYQGLEEKGGLRVLNLFFFDITGLAGFWLLFSLM